MKDLNIKLTLLTEKSGVVPSTGCFRLIPYIGLVEDSVKDQDFHKLM